MPVSRSLRIGVLVLSIGSLCCSTGGVAGCPDRNCVLDYRRADGGYACVWHKAVCCSSGIPTCGSYGEAGQGGFPLVLKDKDIAACTEVPFAGCW